MAKFQYATKDGKLKTIDAANSQAALQLVQGLSDAAKGTGVMVVVDNPSKDVIKNGKVDVSKVPASDVRPFEEPRRDTASVVKTVDNPDGTTTNILSNGQRSTGRYKSGANGSLDFVEEGTSGYEFADISWNQLAPEEQLSRQASNIRVDIEELETRMANRSSERTEMLDDADVFDDLRELNKLKDELRKAQDREVEIPIEARQKLRGRQATKAEFGQATRPALEGNLLEQLAASRATSRLTDTINTNIATVDAFIEAEQAKDEFLYNQKIARLDKVEQIYGNIITEKQKAALEEKKFEQSLILEGIKFNNTVRGDLIKDIATMGVGGAQLQGLMSASVDDLINFKNSVSAPSNWINMTPDQAAMTLSEDQYTRWENYQEWRKTAQEEEDAFMTEAETSRTSAQGVIDTVERMLNNTAGLETSVGALPGGNTVLGDSIFNIKGGLFRAPFVADDANRFRADARQLTSQATLEQLKALKAAGATLGAISEKELQILAEAGQALGTVFDGKGNSTGRFNLSEADFKTALETMRIASMKTYIAASIGKARAASLNIKEADYETVSKLYNEVKANGITPPTNFYEQDRNPVQLEAAFEVLKEEEGLRTEAYQDTTGKWTIGYGNTMINGRPVQPGDRITVGQAQNLMTSSVVNNYTSFADRIKSPISPNQFAALTSFEYNLGSGVWDQPTGKQIVALVDQGRFSEAGRLMLQYNQARNPATGRLEPHPVLAQRRAREANLLLT